MLFACNVLGSFASKDCHWCWNHRPWCTAAWMMSVALYSMLSYQLKLWTVVVNSNKQHHQQQQKHLIVQGRNSANWFSRFGQASVVLQEARWPEPFAISGCVANSLSNELLNTTFYINKEWRRITPNDTAIARSEQLPITQTGNTQNIAPDGKQSVIILTRFAPLTSFYTPSMHETLPCATRAMPHAMPYAEYFCSDQGGGDMRRTTTWGGLHNPPPLFVGQNFRQK